MAFPNVSDIVATTIESRTKQVADNVSNNNKILAYMKKSGTIKPFTGGSVILQELSFAENGNAGWYSGYDNLSTSPSDVISAAQFSIKQAAAPVAMSGLEMLQNSNKEQFIDLLESRLSVAEATLENLITKGLYSDGTGSSGKQLTGLKAAILADPTSGVYGSIDRATWTFWRNKKRKGAGTDFVGTMDQTKILGEMNNIYSQLVRGTDAPNLIVMDTNYWGYYVAALQANQRFANPEVGQAGFVTLKYMGADVVFDTTETGIQANTAYFLNTKYLHFRPHTDRNFTTLDPKKRYSVNQDAEVQIMAWAGNLTCSGTRFQGIITN